MTIREQLNIVNDMVLNGNLTEAAQLLSVLNPLEKFEKRMKAHFEAIIDFHRGNFSESLRLMQDAAAKFGDNVSLMRDIIVCQYHLHDMQGFRASLARLENQLIEFEAQLCENSLIECELMLGKFLEEDARLAPAAQFYDRALQRSVKPAHRLRSLIQKARWQALYEPLPELSNHYRELISISRELLTRDLTIELEHSLMLIELRLIGADHAWQRVQRALPLIDEIDQRLLIFDFIEGSLSQDFEVSQAVRNKTSEFKELDPFESFLRNLVKGSLEQSQLLNELTFLAPKLPWASHLRLLCIAANLEQSTSIRQELHRKIQLIIRGLDKRSQVLWTQRLKEALQTEEIRIDFSARHRSVSIQGKVLDLSKKKIGLQLLERLVAKPSMSVDEAIRLLWQSDFSPEHYHRLRMSVHRLNTLIDGTAGLGKVVEVDSQNVRLRPEVRLRPAPAEEVFGLGLIGI